VLIIRRNVPQQATTASAQLATLAPILTAPVLAEELAQLAILELILIVSVLLRVLMVKDPQYVSMGLSIQEFVTYLRKYQSL